MYDGTTVVVLCFWLLVFSIAVFARNHLKRLQKTPFPGLFEFPQIWHFKCAEKIDDSAAWVEKLNATYFGRHAKAVQWIENAGKKGRKVFFKHAHSDLSARIIYFDVDWTNYRETFPCKWCAMKQLTHDGIKGGFFYTPLMTRSEAVKFVLGAGNHVLRGIWDKDRIVFYTTKA